MKKYFIVIILTITLYAMFTSNVNADSTEYQSFSEIIMPTGKLLCNFTDEEMDSYLEKVHDYIFSGVNIYEVNSNVDASYISEILYAITNDSESDVTYQLDVVYETSKKISVTTSKSLSGTMSTSSKSFVKSELSGKLGIDITTTETTSKKQTEKLDVVVEKHSKMIIYLDGNLMVSNGVLAVFIFGKVVAEGGYEVVTLKNQYVRVEKASIK